MQKKNFNLSTPEVESVSKKDQEGTTVKQENDNQPQSQVYAERTKDEIISDLEAKLANAEKEKIAAYYEGAKQSIRKYPATEYKGRVFKIYKEINDPYENQKTVGEIELTEGVYVGGDLYIVPMQVYTTDNPALLKVVYMIAGGCNSLFYSPALQSDFAEITDNNIRTSLMTMDRKLYHNSGSYECNGICDLTPQPLRIED